MAKSLSTLILVLGSIELHSGAADPSVGPGVVAPIGSFYFRTNATQYIKTGAADTAWTLLSASSITGNSQVFSYTVTGVEPDRSELVIALPTNRANTTYEVFMSQGQAANTYGMAVLTASQLIGQFTLSLSIAATAGDVFRFVVRDPT